jgi:predicted nucleic acid-binding protein
MVRFLLDTNLLVYFYDHNSPEKQARARTLITYLVPLKNASISAQTLSEFTSAVLRKLNPPFSPSEALYEANHLAAAFQVLDLTPYIVLEAIRGVRDYQLSYFDAQIWACARLNQVPVVFSEDFQDGQNLAGVQFVNPFTNQFKLEDW